MMENLIPSPVPPPEWRTISTESLKGLVMIIGASDTGKSSLACYLYHQLGIRKTAFLDGDPGQSSLGPPTTLTISSGATEAPPWVKRWFIGATTPRKHMLPMLVGAARLIEAARHCNCEVILYDTCGLIHPSEGGLALKRSLMDLLRPSTVIAIQAKDELSPLLHNLRRSKQIQVLTFQPSSLVKKRDPQEHRAYRANRFRAYFSNANSVVVCWRDLPVFPWLRFSINRLLSLEDEDGFSLALGIIMNIDWKAHQLTLLTPLSSNEKITAIRLGDLSLDPLTFTESWGISY